MKAKRTPLSRACILYMALFAAAGQPASAQEMQTDKALRIGSGPTGKVYELIVRDIQAVCGAEVPVQSVASIGGIPNLLMLSASQAELGIVQLDTLRVMATGGDDNIRDLQAIMPLHMNLLHVLSLQQGSKVGVTMVPMSGETKVFRKFSDLKGAKVAVVGSTQLLGQTLNAQLGYAMQLQIAESDDQAVRMLRDNKVQAIFTDGGWPLPSISRHQRDSGLMLVDYDVPAQPPFTVAKRTYQNLDAFNYGFLGSPNLLVTRPFKANGDMGKRVAALQACLLKNLDELQEGRYHSAWKEIKNPMETFGWARYSRPESQRAASSAETVGARVTRAKSTK